MKAACFVAGIATLVSCWFTERNAYAQLAPTGSHYAGRASDTGHSPVSGTGAYTTSVPLDVPEARGGMAVPVALTYGRRGVGAAGLGWDVPLSYIQRDTTVARRRPTYTSGGAVAPREQITVTLDGHTIQMVPDGGVWVARQDAPDLELRAEPNNAWRLVDGNGQQLVFTAPNPLLGTNLWLLESVTGVNAADRITLEYDIAQHFFRGASGFVGSGVAIDLRRVYYNAHPTTPSCTKDEVLLGYGPTSSEPLALSLPGVRGSRNEVLPIVRARTLQEITISRRESCISNLQPIRRYQLEYISVTRHLI